MKQNRLKKIYDNNVATPEINGVFVVLILLSFTSANPVLTVYALASLPIIIHLLWRKGEAPIFVFVAAFQWLQASAMIFHANFNGKTIDEFQTYEGAQTAIWLSITGVLVLSLGIKAILASVPVLTTEQLKEEIKSIDTNRLFIVYLSSFVVAFILDKFKFSIPQLSQIIVSLVQLKWVVFFVFVAKILLEKSKAYYIISVITIEIIIGFSGYFASFKEVFFYFFVTFLTVKYRMEAKTLIPIALAFVVLVFLAMFWTGVKDEYRKFVNGGTAGQVVLVSNSEKLDKLLELYELYDSRYLNMSLDAMIKRVAYVDFFGATTHYVPSYRPHTNGALWLGAVAHILMPRLLFPDKPVLPSDSEHTMKYTGILLASGNQGVSFSIGYMGDSFIDFGYIGMFVPIFILGLIWGSIYKTLLKRGKYKITAMAFAMIVLMPAYQLERTSVKLLGIIIMGFLVMSALMWYMEEPFFKFLNPQHEDEEDANTKKGKRKTSLRKNIKSKFIKKSNLINLKKT